MLGQKTLYPPSWHLVVFDQCDGADVPQKHEREEECGDKLKGADVNVDCEDAVTWGGVGGFG